MLQSDYRALCAVKLPYCGRQHYMHTFDIGNPQMREGFEDYLEPVTRLCRAAGLTNGIAHMTVDEKVVKAGMSQRRPKPHVDGCFVPATMDWSHPIPGWLHNCNDIRRGPIQRMAVIVAATVAGCRAWRGRFNGQPASDGDLSHIQNQLNAAYSEVLPADTGYLLSPDCVHESMIFTGDTQRTFLRIAVE